MMRRKSLAVFVAGLLMLCTFAGLCETQTRLLRRAIDNYVYDNRDHYLPCSVLPTREEVESVLAAHQDFVQAIEEVNPGFIGVELGTPCHGKADILIWYGGHKDRVTIEEMIGGDLLFGIPYRMHNR